MLDLMTVLENLSFDDDGFMTDVDQWNEDVARAIAQILEIELTHKHWEVINYSRSEYAENDDAPSLRKITKTLNIPTKDLYALFPGGPAKIAAKIAGLPKPTGCI